MIMKICVLKRRRKSETNIRTNTNTLIKCEWNKLKYKKNAEKTKINPLKCSGGHEFELNINEH